MSEKNLITDTTLVLGATGKTGRRIANRLTARGLPVRAGSRAGHPPFDWEDRRTWAPALQGARAAYVTYYPDLAVPGAADALGSFAELAVESGVRRLVLLSGRGEEGARLGETAVQDSGADWTILRCSWFDQNFSEGNFLGLVLGGVVALPTGDVAEPFVDVDDIADVAVAALTDDSHAGEVYELTGPRLLTFAEACQEIATATGRDVRYEQISIEQFASALAEQGEPGEVVALLNYVFTEVLDGRNAHLADGVQRALGRGPRDFSEFARSAAAAGAWGALSAARR
ncbi:MAG: NAD(P)H-binding protein [Acidobacteria bacterium]|nr:NAD(P)H-binding protein [Acidobacteriota bacterium]